MTNEEAITILSAYITCLKCGISGKPCDVNCKTQYEAGTMGEMIVAINTAIEALKAQDKGLDQWCSDCKEYDNEKHCCPRFNRVIRTALQDSNLHDTCTEVAQDTISRQDAIDIVEIIRDRISVEGYCAFLERLNKLPSAEPKKRTEERTKTHECDLISRQDAINIVNFECGKWTGLAKTIANELEKLSPAEPIIRCKDCKWFRKAGCAIEIVDDSDKPTEDDYCSFAERRTDEGD